MRFSNDASWELEIDIEIEINLMRYTKYNWANSTCFLFQYTPFCVLLVTTWMKSPRADTSHQSGRNTSHSPHVVSPEHKRLHTLKNNNFFQLTFRFNFWRWNLSKDYLESGSEFSSGEAEVGRQEQELPHVGGLAHNPGGISVFQFFSIAVFQFFSISVFQYFSFWVGKSRNFLTTCSQPWQYFNCRRIWCFDGRRNS